MKNYVASTTINFEGSKFYVRPGDMLTHDAQHGNSLAVYRNGQLVKVLKADSLIVEAFLKSKFITEVKKPAKPILNLGILTKEQGEEVGNRLKISGECTLGFDMKDRFNNPVNDLGNTPAAQAGMDAIAEQADEAIERGVPQFPKTDKKRRKKPQEDEVDFSVHPPDPLPTQGIGPEEAPPPLEQAEM